MTRQSSSTGFLERVLKLLFPEGIAFLLIVILFKFCSKDELTRLKTERQETQTELQKLEKDVDYKVKSPREYGWKELDLREKEYRLDALIKELELKK